jgi:uncharacterized membrane protein YkoI
MRLLLCLVFPVVPLSALPALAAKRLTIDDARDMAFAKGVVTIKEIELDGGIWEVEGRNAGGRRIKIEVDARSGEIVKIKRK